MVPDRVVLDITAYCRAKCTEVPKSKRLACGIACFEEVYKPKPSLAPSPSSSPKPSTRPSEKLSAPTLMKAFNDGELQCLASHYSCIKTNTTGILNRHYHKEFCASCSSSCTPEAGCSHNWCERNRNGFANTKGCLTDSYPGDRSIDYQHWTKETVDCAASYTSCVFLRKRHEFYKPLFCGQCRKRCSSKKCMFGRWCRTNAARCDLRLRL